jgi:hypothetical protein
MYGIVNQAIQGLVTDNYGVSAWEKIRIKAGVDGGVFLASQLYDDDLTYALAASASEVLSIPVDDVLKAFGKYWVLNVGKEKYGTLMKSGGGNIIEFLRNLPNFHSRVMLIYPNAQPPEFKVDIVSENVVHLHYFSARMGLTSFMSGIIEGLSDFFGTPCSINHLKHNVTDINHDLFEIIVD